MSKFIDIDDDKNVYWGMRGEYEMWSIDPDVLNEAKEIIFCKDCIYHSDIEEDGSIWCDRLTGTFKVKHDSFCSFGEKIK